MLKKKIIIPALVVFLLADFAFSFLQYYHTPLCGDIEGGVLPKKGVLQILNDPFGFHAIATGEKHINPNRFFSHWSLREYLQKVPGWLQYFVSPIDSVYLASALLKLAVQITFIFLLALFITNKKNIFNKEFLLCAALVAPLFQVYGYWSRMGIVDKSIANTFFYAVPLVFLMVFLLPFFRLIQGNGKLKAIHLFYLVPLTIALPLSGPLIPGVVLVVSTVVFMSYLFKSNPNAPVVFLLRLRANMKSMPAQIFYLIPISLWSFYALFLGRYDLNYLTETIPAPDRYLRLPYGLYRQVFHSLGVPLLLIMIGVNSYFIRKRFFSDEGKKITHTLKWIGVFAAVYVLLLPLGGYRPYRPYTIRFDTIMPVTVALIYIFGASSWFLFSEMRGKLLRKYRIAIILVLAIYTFADTSGLSKNKGERHALKILANSKDKIVRLPDDCTVMSWGKTYDYRKSVDKAELLQFWGITKEKKLFYQQK